jgi:hypothetical protein
LSNEVKGQPRALCPHLPRMRTAMGWEWQAAELRLLINSHCPIISVESSEEDRFAVMLWCVAADIGVALCLWSATEGLSRAGGTALYNCDQPEQALANMATIQGDAVFLLKDLCVIARTTRSAGFCAIWRTDFATATIDCAAGGDDRIAERACGGRGRVSTGAAVGGALKTDGLLETVRRDTSFTDVVGLLRLREWIAKRKSHGRRKGSDSGWCRQKAC